MGQLPAAEPPVDASAAEAGVLPGVSDVAPRRPAPGQAPAPRPRGKAGQSLFRVIWRWHFFAGLFVAPIVMVVAVTGGIYLFSAEIGDVANRDLLYVNASTSTSAGSAEEATAQALVAAAEAAVPGGYATGLTWRADPRRTVEVSIETPFRGDETAEPAGERRGAEGLQSTAYLHPRTAEVQAVSAEPQKLSGFFAAVLKIHRQLFLGTTGRIVVELATCWTIVLFLTGAYLWWPRRKEKVRGVWLPRWSAKPYTLLRDLHALAGIYLWPVCLTILVTGLFYTLVWGESFHVVSRQAFAATTASADAAQTPGERLENAPAKSAAAAPETFTFEQAVAKSRALAPGRDVTVKVPAGPEDDYEVSTINDYARGTYGAMTSIGFKLDRRSGEAFGHEDLADNERYWWHAWVYPLHVGSVLGPASKVVWLFACLAMAALPMTGLWMWWKRRPAGRSGFPRETSLEVVSPWLWGAIALLCALLPAFGISLALVVGLDWAYGRVRPSGLPSRP
ncbi:PepSY-associated TM helix domain-containing protein [Alienimonas sp. DA493]|uniref:PepSY-associated TM helix domain-containing protein n=1 Tax=Alienimonas sp. DA493 TaxID=3373605 RepID=UPI003754E486